VWKHLGHGRFLAEKAEIKFDAQTAEIFWRNDELKPVPDSMTRFSDFEGLFGSRAFYCGVVLRNQHRNWVHIVGTEYDLQEWDRPKAADQGVGAPTESKVEEAGKICLRCGKTNQCFQCEACTVVNCEVELAPETQCSVCGTPRGGKMEEMPRIFGRTEKKEPAVKADRAIYNGVLFSRAFDPYSDEPHPHKSEEWAVQILRYILLSEYPPMPPTEQMKWQLLLPEEVVKDDANKVRLIGCDAADKPEATWKEIVIFKQRKMLLAFNLISHGRRVWCTQLTLDSPFTTSP